jgi:hypothetical protein
MSIEQSQTDASSREHSPDHQYSLSIEATADLYAQAGHPRTIRAIQKYCALSKLDCHKVETETGEKYLVAPYSVTRHIAYIHEVRPVVNERGQSRTDATVLDLLNKEASATNRNEQARTDAALPGVDRYVSQLESENTFLRGQMEIKDTQIKELTERARETNILIGGFQKMLSPLLSPPADNHRDPPMPL